MGKNTEIRKLLIQVKLTQKELAKRCGVSRATISRWLNEELTEQRKDRILQAVIDSIFEVNHIHDKPFFI